MERIQRSITPMERLLGGQQLLQQVHQRHLGVRFAFELVAHNLKGHCRLILAILGFYYEKIAHFLLILTLYSVFQLRHPFLLFHGPK